MANDALPKAEVPDAFRDLMKISIEQTKRAFETFAATSEKAWKTFETSSQPPSLPLLGPRRKASGLLSHQQPSADRPPSTPPEALDHQV